MFFRSVKVRSSSGAVHEYVRLVESIRIDGRPRQQVIANLGRRDLLESLLPQLTSFLKGDGAAVKLSRAQAPVEPIDSSTWGPVLVARWAFEELRLWTALEPRGPATSSQTEPVFADRVLALVGNRLTEPSSEHGLARWLETYFVCDRQGRRFRPLWKSSGRVKVDFSQLQSWYRTLDGLVQLKPRLEEALYARLRDLFSLKPDLVFYDLTSTYFEGRGPLALARHGYSRDGKPRNTQILVGVVMVNGWPIAHHVFRGNLRDSQTVTPVLDDLERRFHVGRIVFVGDRGMVSTDNLNEIRKREQGYLVGLTRRRRPEVEQLVDRATGPWIACPVGITASEKKTPPKTQVQEVATDREGVRVFVVESEERRTYEQAQREKAMARVRQDLERLQGRVEKGRLRRPEKIGAAAARALARHHGDRYYAWKLEEGRFLFFEHPENLPREKKYEGKYLIQTEEKNLTALQAVAFYKELSEVERGFRHLKDPLGLRPIFHRRPSRVEAHVFVAALAFLLDRLLERRLKDAKVDLSSTEALQALQTVRHVSFRVSDELRTGVTPGSPRAQQVLKALGILDRHPPKPPPTGEA